MASSSPDQSTAAKISPSSAPKRRIWPGLVITFSLIVLLVIIILCLLTTLNILPAPWLWPTLSLALGGIGTFLKATLSDKDFQQSLRGWLSKRLFGENSDSKKETASPAQPTFTINISPTITNTNTATAAPPITPQISSPAPNLPTHPTPDITTTASIPQKPAAAPSRQIFFPSMKLTDPHEFYGRHMQRIQLLNRTRKGDCTSIVGSRRSGKTWLMTHLRLIMEQELGPDYCCGYVSATLPNVDTRINFAREALKALDQSVYILPASPDLKVLQEVVSAMSAQSKTPVLCIDEFEGFMNHPEEFDLAFFEGLRAITEIGLSLIVLSKEPLIDLVSENTKNSPFFNVFLQLKLVPFGREEAEHFFAEKGALAQFTEQERRYCVSYSQTEKEQFPPLRLQLVGDLLLNDKDPAIPGTQYSPDDPDYWQEFKQRVDEAYSGMVKL